MVHPDILNAFETLGLTVDTDLDTATRAYKRLALRHHPDRNHGDATATQRFQQISAAWDICQRHLEQRARGYDFLDARDDVIWLDSDDLDAFYVFMFSETLFGRYSRDSRRFYRDHRHHPASTRTSSAQEQQRKEKEEYEKRRRELEEEIEREERERVRMAKELKAAEDRRATAWDQAFQAALAGDADAVRQSVLDSGIDVNAPRKRGKQPKKQAEHNHETLLHLAAKHCDETLAMFLIGKGANTELLNKDLHTPFHAAISAGNVPVVRYLLHRDGKALPGCHPSKAAPSGATPLQLAVESGSAEMVDLLVKDATTHDVERLWKQAVMSEEIRDALRTKKGFIPPEERDVQPPSQTKKSFRKQEEERQKEARIAEELARAAANRQKKEERERKRAEEAASLAAAEEEERLRQEAAHRLKQEQEQEALKRARLAEEEARKKAEHERKLQEERRARELARRDEEARAQEQRRQEQARRAEETRLRLAEEARDREHKASQMRAEQERKDAEERQAAEAKQRRRDEDETNQRGHTRKEAPVPPPRNLPKERRKSKYAVKRAEMVAQRQEKLVNSDMSEEMKAVEMKRRAEQSARDRERHQRKKEAYLPPTPVSIRQNSISPAPSSMPATPLLEVQSMPIPDDLFRDDQGYYPECFAQTVEPLM